AGWWKGWWRPRGLSPMFWVPTGPGWGRSTWTGRGSTPVGPASTSPTWRPSPTPSWPAGFGSTTPGSSPSLPRLPGNGPRGGTAGPARPGRPGRCFSLLEPLSVLARIRRPKGGSHRIRCPGPAPGRLPALGGLVPRDRAAPAGIGAPQKPARCGVDQNGMRPAVAFGRLHLVAPGFQGGHQPGRGVVQFRLHLHGPAPVDHPRGGDGVLGIHAEVDEAGEDVEDDPDDPVAARRAHSTEGQAIVEDQSGRKTAN